MENHVLHIPMWSDLLFLRKHSWLLKGNQIFNNTKDPTRSFDRLKKKNLLTILSNIAQEAKEANFKTFFFFNYKDIKSLIIKLPEPKKYNDFLRAGNL